MPAMDDFSRDCLRLGCLRAFVHFSLTLRGREELVVTVRTQVRMRSRGRPLISCPDI
jgi:hypothetical protein